MSKLNKGTVVSATNWKTSETITGVIVENRAANGDQGWYDVKDESGQVHEVLARIVQVESDQLAYENVTTVRGWVEEFSSYILTASYGKGNGPFRTSFTVKRMDGKDLAIEPPHFTGDEPQPITGVLFSAVEMSEYRKLTRRNTRMMREVHRWVRHVSMEYLSEEERSEVRQTNRSHANNPYRHRLGTDMDPKN